MKVTTKIQKIVDEANNARFNLASHVIAGKRSETQAMKEYHERAQHICAGMYEGLLEALTILGIDLDKDVELDSWDISLKQAELHFRG